MVQIRKESYDKADEVLARMKDVADTLQMLAYGYMFQDGVDSETGRAVQYIGYSLGGQITEVQELLFGSKK